MFYTQVVPHFGNLLVRGYVNGKRFNEKVKPSPYIFVEARNGKPTEYKDFKGQKPLSKITFDSSKEMKEFISRYEDVENFKIHGNSKFQYDWISDNYPENIPYDMDSISIVSLDIEVASDDGFPEPDTASKEVTAITLSKRGKYYVFGCKDYKVQSNDVKYCKCKNEKELLHKFLDFWKVLDPDIITGWNCELFDMPYLYNRITNVLSKEDANSLSHWNYVSEKEINQKYGKGIVKNILGVTILDYMVLYKKYSNTPQENYRLNTVASHELDVGKIDYTGSLTDLYKTDYQKFIDYNIRDVELINMLDDKLKFIELTCAVAYDAKVNISDALTTVTLWDVIIQNYLKKNNRIIPYQSTGKVAENVSIQGGYVKDPQVGFHEWVVSWDFDSLYPHIAMMLNISPDTFVEMNVQGSVDMIIEKGFSSEFQKHIKNNNLSVALNGATFTRNKVGFFSDLMKTMYQDRLKYKKLLSDTKKQYQKNPSDELKKKMAKYNAFQYAKKIQLNSAYGALANSFYRWYNNDLAEAITMTGQYCIRYIEKRMNQHLNQKNKTKIDYVVASDTDSVYVKFLNKDKIDEKEMNTNIDIWCREIYETLNAFDGVLKMKREAIASSAIWTSKKHYVLNMIDLEGIVFTEPKLKMMGIEAIKSSTPTAVRTALIEAIKIVMNDDQEKLFNYISNINKQFKTKKYEEVSFPRSVNNLSKYHDTNTIWSKGAPVHVKGALVYNKFIENTKMKYPTISEGDKIKFCYLKMPNPLKSEVIATPNELPEKLGLSAYIDYDTQFEKAFLQPLKVIAEQRNWKVERRSTLFD